MPLTCPGRAASSTDPGTWASYREACESRVGTGIGFVLDGDGIVCLDIDHCIENDNVAGWAQRILDLLPETFVEVSASGTGLHVFGFGDVHRGRKVRLDGGSVEIYGWGRYIAVTGQRHANAPRQLADISEAIASLT